MCSSDLKLSWPAAVARWKDCKNPGKAYFFKIGELWALMKRFSRHQLFLAMAEDLGYEVRQRPTEDRRQELLERIAKAIEASHATTDAAMSELARLTSNETVASVSRDPGGQIHFSLEDEDDTGMGF